MVTGAVGSLGLLAGCLTGPLSGSTETATRSPTPEPTSTPGYAGTYYNLPVSHPDMESSLHSGTGLVEDTLPLRLTDEGEEHIDQFDWYSDEYEAFSRVDEQLQWERDFLPFEDGEKEGDPYHFTVHWTATLLAPEADEYLLRVASDDDSWVFVDEELVLDNGGVHEFSTVEGRPRLSAGEHSLEIFYAERYTVSAGLVFLPDERLDARSPSG